MTGDEYHSSGCAGSKGDDGEGLARRRGVAAARAAWLGRGCRHAPELQGAGPATCPGTRAAPTTPAERP